MKKRKLWKISEFDKNVAQRLADELKISTLAAGILVNRGIDSPDAAREFLYGAEEPFHNPMLMKDMEKSVDRILKAIDAGEKITVYGDYDVDGITASSLLYLFLKDMGACVTTYIPERKSEGYGLNADALQTLFDNGTTLIVTVDCGISAVPEVAGAPKGLDIVITDHHTPPKILPDAYALVNPHQDDCAYPFKHLSGVGVAFKLCQALYKSKNPTDKLWCGYTEFVALGTIADIVPLQNENRELVKIGLKAMETTNSIGLKKLMLSSRCPAKNIVSENVSFILAPRLNAVGRLEHAQRAVELLVTDSAEEAETIAAELNSENLLRQEISRKIFVEAEEMLAKKERVANAIVLAKEGWHAGVIGIVASRLVDKYHLPVVLLSITDGQAKGSCRSIPALDLYKAISACSDLLIQFGGHHQAAGLTMPAENIDKFVERFTQTVADTLVEEDYLPRVSIDAVIDNGKKVDLTLLRELKLLEPFGSTNPAPNFMFANAALKFARVFGRENNHLRFFAECEGFSYHCLMWNGANHISCLYNGANADLVFMPKLNIWQGEETVNLQIVDFKENVLVYDYRSEKSDKKSIVKNILQTGQKTVIYVNNNHKNSLVNVVDSYYLSTYDDGPDTSAYNIVLYDLPGIDILKWLSKIAHRKDFNLYFLYDMNDYDASVANFAKKYPGRADLVESYKKLCNILKQQIVADKAILTKENEIEELHLQIFEELGFIEAIDGNISLKSSKKNELSNSKIFRELQEKGKVALTEYKRNMQFSQRHIAQVFNGN